MNIAICDDNTVFTADLERAVRRWLLRQELCGAAQRFESGEKLLAADLSGCDLLLLDIEMPGVDGLRAARMLRRRWSELLIVFVTGYIRYAPAGYRVNAFRYLLKSELDAELPRCLDEVREKLEAEATLVTLSTRDGAVELAVRQIVFCEGAPSRTVLVHRVGQSEPLRCSLTLADCETLLTGRGFLRIQKSFLVNMVHVTRIHHYMAVLDDGRELKVSERQYSNVRQEFLLWRASGGRSQFIQVERERERERERESAAGKGAVAE